MRWFYHCRQIWTRLAGIPRDTVATTVLLWLAYLISKTLINHTGIENNSALVFVLAVMLISTVTTGYVYGVLASLVGGFCINYFFMYPYSAFSLDYAGYPVAIGSMVMISIIACTMTARIKLMAQEAARREQKAKALYEQNQRLNQEKTAIELEAARESIRGNILRAVSHDLRTPLTAISGAAAVLLDSPDKNISLIQGIKDDADSMITMIENLLSITRIQDAASSLKKREELLEEVAGDAAMTMQRRFPECEISLELSDDILYLPMEPTLIKQVIVNLLENAIRHSGDHQPIQLSLSREGKWAIVEVRDHGHGLSPELLELIQSGRQITKQTPSDSSRGMGIGLSVCQSIIKAHDGFFYAGNHPDGGAVFRFGLPAEYETNEDSEDGNAV